MKLGIFLDDVFTRDGTAIYADRAFPVFLAALAEHVDRLVVIGRLDPKPGRSHYRLPAGVELVALPHYPRMSDPWSAARAMLRAVRHVWRALDDLDAVWAFGPHPLAPLFALFAAVRRRRITLGVRQEFARYVRNRHPHRPGLIFAGYVLEASNRLLATVMPVVVVGPELARRYGRSRRLMTLVVSHIEDDDLAAAAARNGEWTGTIRLLSVGRLEGEKNPLLLADVLARVSEDDPRWRLVVCGEGPLRAQLEDRLRQLHVEDRADIKGYVPIDGGLRELYRSSDALVHLSWTEGFPAAVLEALGAGLPVVATNVGGIPALAGNAALLIPPGDADGAARALRALADDPSLRRRLRAAGIEVARAHTRDAECRRVARFLAGGDPIEESASSRPVDRFEGMRDVASRTGHPARAEAPRRA
jgi:glycosyltransferase involved in cell wall biosynthesis